MCEILDFIDIHPIIVQTIETRPLSSLQNINHSIQIIPQVPVQQLCFITPEDRVSLLPLLGRERASLDGKLLRVQVLCEGEAGVCPAGRNCLNRTLQE